MKINVERFNGHTSVLTISIRFFDGLNLGEDISSELAGFDEITTIESEAWSEIQYWREEVECANSEGMADTLEPLTMEQIANGCEYVFEWREFPR